MSDLSAISRMDSLIFLAYARARDRPQGPLVRSEIVDTICTKVFNQVGTACKD